MHFSIRLPEYDYSSNGAYFLTICTQNKAEFFGGGGIDSPVGQMIGETFEEVLSNYPQMRCPQYVVMPNHFHALVVVDKMSEKPSATIARMVQAFKSKTTVAYIRMVKSGKAVPFEGKLWQRSYYDHVIRNEQDYLETWKYIEENPLKWKLKKE